MLNTFDQIQTINPHNNTVFQQSQKLFLHLSISCAIEVSGIANANAYLQMWLGILF